MRSENLPNDRQAQRTLIETVRRAQIVESTIEVLAEHGHGNASLALIAQRAGISKGVISYHFNGKADLLEQVEQDVSLAMEAAITPLIEAETTARGMLSTFIRSTLEYMRDNRSHLLALIEIFYMKSHRRDRRPEYETFEYEPVLAGLEQILRFGQEAGEFGTFNSRVMAVALWGSIEATFTQWAAFPDLDLDEYIRELCALYDRTTLRVDH